MQLRVCRAQFRSYPTYQVAAVSFWNRIVSYCFIFKKGPFCPILNNLLTAKGKPKIGLSYECTYKYGHNIVNL